MTRRPLLCLTLVAASLAACGDATPTATPDAAPVDVTPDALVDAAPDAALDATVDAARDASADTPADVARDATQADSASDASSSLALTSPVFVHGGTLPAEYTCDGVGHSPPLAWTGAPPGTAGFVLLMTTLARDGLKWNWVLHGIPATARGLAMASTGVGVAGRTSDGPALAYAPPCSRGPGPMQYTFTLYALSSAPTLPDRPELVTGAVLTDAISAITLARSAVTVTYTR